MGFVSRYNEAMAINQPLQSIDPMTQCRDYQRIEQALRFIERHAPRQPSLPEIAAHLDLSEFHFQRVFREWVGITPKRFMQFLTKEYAKSLLARSDNLLSVAYDAGLSGTGRLHDLFVQCEAMTPGEYRRGGAGLNIDYVVQATPFGQCLVAQTARGICALRFLTETDDCATTIADLQHEWPQAQWRQVERGIPQVEEWFAARPAQRTRLLLKGTNFQIKVWEALLAIPYGSIVSYEGLARRIGMPTATRAVASAVARNSIAVLIPCHRVIHKIGDSGHYRWGRARKRALLAWEAAQTEIETAP